MDPITVLSRYADYRSYELERLAEFIESSVRKELKWWKEWVEKQTKHMTPEEAEEFGEQYSDEYQMVKQDFLRHLRYGYVVTVYGMTESQLNRTCSIIKRSRDKYKKEQIQLEVKDINAESIIQRARKYLEKILLLSFPKRDRSWQEITTLSRVRNIIVHNEGYDTNGNLGKYVKGNPNLLKYGTNRQLEIEAAYCKFIQEQFQKFFDALYEANKGLFNNNLEADE